MSILSDLSPQHSQPRSVNLTTPSAAALRGLVRPMVRHLVRSGLLDWEGRSHAPGTLPLPWGFAFTSTAFEASLLAAAQNNKG